VAQFDASILFKSAVDESSLRRAVTKIQQVSQLAAQIKPISLFDKGGTSKEVLERVNTELDKILKTATTISKGSVGPGKLSGSFAGAAQQASVISDVLANVNLKTRAGQQEVQTLAKAFGVAAEQAAEVEKRFNSFLNDARQARARELEILTPEIQDALNPVRRGPTASDSDINDSINRQAAAVDDYFQQRRNVEGQIQALEERRTRETFELESRYTELETEKKIKAINEQAAKELQEGKETNAKLLRDFDQRLAAQESKKRSRSRLRENLALGAGFPLLFGGGVGSVAGGIAGSFLGDGFGGQILLSALGQQIDNFIQKLSGLADSLDSAEKILDGLANAGLRVSKELRTAVETLEDQGRFIQAYQVALGELERRFGPNAVQQLSNYDAANEDLQEQISELSASLQRDLLPALTLVTQGVAGLLSLIEQSGGILKFLAGIVPGGQGVANAVGIGSEAARRVTESPTNAFGFQDNTGPAAAAAKEAEAAQKRSADLVRQINQNQEKINAAKRTAAREETTHQKEMLRLSYERTRIEIDAMKKRIALQSQLIINANKLKIRQLEGILAERDARKEMAQATLSLLESGKQPSITDTNFEETFNLLQEFELEEIKDKAGILGQKLADAGYDVERINKFTAKYRKTLSEAATEASRLERIKRNLLELDRRQDSFRSESNQRRQLADSADALQRAELQFANPFGGDAYEAEIQKLDQIRELQDILNTAKEKSLELNRQLAAAQSKEEEERIDQKIRNQDLVNKQIRDEALARQEVERAILRQQQVLEKLQPITDGLAAGITDFFTAIVDGSKSAEEAFADMLIGMGQALIQTAAQMIAQYIAIGIARAFAGIPPSGSSTPMIGTDTNYFGQGFNPMSYFNKRADGGPVDSATPYIVGERGPELFQPRTSGTIRSNETMSNYMPSNSTTTSMANAPINMTYNGPTLNFNGDEYIPRSEAPQLVAQGAKMGEMRTMASLKNNRSSRSRIGL